MSRKREICEEAAMVPFSPRLLLSPSKVRERVL